MKAAIEQLGQSIASVEELIAQAAAGTVDALTAKPLFARLEALSAAWIEVKEAEQVLTGLVALANGGLRPPPGVNRRGRADVRAFFRLINRAAALVDSVELPAQASEAAKRARGRSTG